MTDQRTLTIERIAGRTIYIERNDAMGDRYERLHDGDKVKFGLAYSITGSTCVFAILERHYEISRFACDEGDKEAAFAAARQWIMDRA